MVGRPSRRRSEIRVVILPDNATAEGNQPVKVLVYPYARQVRYRWVFAVPAAVALVLSGALIGIAALMGVTGKKGGTPSRIAELLRLLSVGRLLDVIVQDEKNRGEESEQSCDHDHEDKGQDKETLWTMSRKAWIERSGSYMIKLPVTSRSQGHGEEKEGEMDGRRDHRRDEQGMESRLRISDPRVEAKNTAVEMTSLIQDAESRTSTDKMDTQETEANSNRMPPR